MDDDDNDNDAYDYDDDSSGGGGCGCGGKNCAVSGNWNIIVLSIAILYEIFVLAP